MEFYKISVAFKDKDCAAYIPEKFQYIFQDTRCPICGSELEISETRCIVRCPNLKCGNRLAYTYAKIYKNLGVKGFAYANLRDYIRDNMVAINYANKENLTNRFKQIANPEFEYKPITPYISALARFNAGEIAHDVSNRIDILKYPPNNCVEAIKAALQEPRTFAQAVELLQIPGVGSRARLVFAECDSFKDFLDKANKNNGIYNYLLTKVFSKNSEVLSKQVMQSLKDFQVELNRIPEIFNIISSRIIQIPVVITGNVANVKDPFGNKLTKRGFIARLNEVSEPLGKRFDLRDSTTEQTAILVSDSGTNSNNFSRAVAINRKRENTSKPQIIITDSASLLASIMDIVQMDNIGEEEEVSSSEKSFEHTAQF